VHFYFVPLINFLLVKSHTLAIWRKKEQNEKNKAQTDHGWDTEAYPVEAFNVLFFMLLLLNFQQVSVDNLPETYSLHQILHF